MMVVQSLLAVLFGLVDAPFAMPFANTLTLAPMISLSSQSPTTTSVSTSGQNQVGATETASSAHAVPGNRKPLVVMAIGGSAAIGWGDIPSAGGYLNRAVLSVSTQLNVPVKFWNESIGGYTPERLGGYFARLLRAYRPNIVIISWGVLNDLAAKTPLNTFDTSISQEVALSIQSGAKVWIVTPPATEASFSSTSSVTEQVYAGSEITAAESVNFKDVQTFDLLGTMKQYLSTNHQDIKMYAHDGWHPNEQGYILAGQLLSDMIVNRRSTLGL